MKETVLQVENLQKDFKAKSGVIHAVKHVSFQVEKGEIFGFLGANGAGKSTTINMVTTQLLPTGGKILYDGKDLTGDVAAIRRKIGVVAQHNNLERQLTAEENLIITVVILAWTLRSSVSVRKRCCGSLVYGNAVRTLFVPIQAAWRSVSRLRGPCSTIRKFSSSMSRQQALTQTIARFFGTRCLR